jgi:hypothetical protein
MEWRQNVETGCCDHSFECSNGEWPVRLLHAKIQNFRIVPFKSNFIFKIIEKQIFLEVSRI